MAAQDGQTPGNGIRNNSQERSLVPLCQITTPVGMLGYGFDEDEFNIALQQLTSFDIPTAIILDSGSTDSGPSKLASGHSTNPRSAYKRDLTKLLKALLKYHVPLLISSAGGDGSDAHVDDMIDIITEIMADLLQQGNITGCGPVVPPLTIENVETSPTIVAQMGPEPLLEAMKQTPDFDILVAGRAYDPAPYISYSAFQAMKATVNTFQTLGTRLLGGFTHMGKIMECGGICATPKSRGATATVYTDGTFDIKPTNPEAKCTPLSVAAHTLYEKTRPDILHGPGGWLDLTTTNYVQLEDNVSVRVSGATFTFTVDAGSPYTVKLEGARNVGFRCMFIGYFKDPILIGQLRSFLDIGRKYIEGQHPTSAGSWKIDWHLTGLEEQEVTPDFIPKKVFIVGEVLADTQEVANGVCSTARVYCAHGPYPGQKATSGNFAMGIGGKMDLPLGDCAEFSIYHLMNLKPGEEIARETTEDNATGKETNQPLFSWKKIIINEENDEARDDDEVSGYAKRLLAIQGPKSVHAAEKELSIASSPRTLRDVAKVIRSKNAGPFEITFDIMFEDIEVYEVVKGSGLLCAEAISKLYNTGSTDVIVWSGFFDQALAFKATLPRTRKGTAVCSGGYMEDDVHGSQQYIPLLQLPLGAALILKLESLVHEKTKASHLT